MTSDNNNIADSISLNSSVVAGVGNSVPKKEATNNSTKHHSPPATKENTKATKGEKAFNRGVYYGVGWGANSLISMIAADKIIHGSGQVPMADFSMWTVNKTEGIGKGQLKLKDIFNESKNIWEKKDFLNARKMTNHLKDEYKDIWQASQKETGKSIEGFYQKLEETVGKTKLIDSLKDKKLLAKEGEALTKEFESLSRASHVFTKRAGLLSFIALQIGGWLTIIPIKLLEDKKVGITKWLDNKLNRDDISVNESKEIEQRHEYLEVEPKQSWKSELGSRALVQPLIVGFYLITRGTKNIFSKIGVDFDGTDAIMERNIDKVFSDTPKSGSLYEKIVNSLSKTPEKLEKSFSHLDEAEKIFEKSSGAKRFKDSVVMNGALEAFYAGIIAVGTFIVTRSLGPYFANKDRNNSEENRDSEQPINRAEKINMALNKSSKLDNENRNITSLPNEDSPNLTIIDKATIDHQGLSSKDIKHLPQL